MVLRFELRLIQRKAGGCCGVPEEKAFVSDRLRFVKDSPAARTAWRPGIVTVWRPVESLNPFNPGGRGSNRTLRTMGLCTAISALIVSINHSGFEHRRLHCPMISSSSSQLLGMTAPVS